jgi:hypothetical protein
MPGSIPLGTDIPAYFLSTGDPEVRRLQKPVSHLSPATSPDRRPDSRHCVTGGKTTLDHGGTHLPLLIRWPRTIEPGAVTKDIIDVADFSPTFCELARVEIPDEIHIDGISFAGRCPRDEPCKRKYTVAAYERGASIFDGN